MTAFEIVRLACEPVLIPLHRQVRHKLIDMVRNPFRRWGLKPWSLKHPARTLLSMVGNVINGIESSRPELGRTATGNHHLFAVARKAMS
jgi:hypothetical protein